MLAATFRVLTGLLRNYAAADGVIVYERGFADWLDEGPHRLRPIGRTRSHEPADGPLDAGLSYTWTAHRARPGTRSRSLEARRHSRLEYARGARLSPSRTRSGRSA